MKKRKHRLVVEFTTSKAVTEKRSAQLLQMLVDRTDRFAKPIDALGIYADKIQTKQFSRVFTAEASRRAYELQYQINVEGNNGGSYIQIYKVSEGMINLEVGETCIRTIKQDISVVGLACLLTWLKDYGMVKALQEYQKVLGTDERIRLDEDLAVALRNKPVGV